MGATQAKYCRPDPGVPRRSDLQRKLESVVDLHRARSVALSDESRSSASNVR